MHDIIKVQQEIALFVVAIILASYRPFEVTKIYVESWRLNMHFLTALFTCNSLKCINIHRSHTSPNVFEHAPKYIWHSYAALLDAKV